MKLTKKKKIAISVCAVILALIIVIVSVLSGRAKNATSVAAYQNTQAQYSSISKTVAATGNLEFADAGEVKVISGILVDEVLVETGDSVKEGDILAKLNKTSVINKLVDAIEYETYIKETLDDSNSELTALEKEALTAELEDTQEIIAELEELYDSPVIKSTATGIIGELEIAEGNTTGTSSSSVSAAASSSGSDISSILSAYMGYISVSPVLMNVGGAAYASQGDDTEDSTEPSETDTTEPSLSNSTEPSSSETTKRTITLPTNASSSSTATTKKSTTTTKKSTTTTKDSSSTTIDYSSVLASLAADATSTTKASSGKTTTTTKSSQSTTIDYSSILSGAAGGITQGSDTSGIDYSAALAAAAAAAGSDSASSDTDYSAVLSAMLGSSAETATGSDYSDAISAMLASSGDTSSLLSSTPSFSASKVSAVSLYSGSKAKIEISIDELDILDIAKGQSAAITIDAISGGEYTGEITAISTGATTGSGNAKYTIDVTLDKDDDMRMGMSASVVITIDSKDNALIIPTAALQEKDSQVFVYTGTDSDGALTDAVYVETGISDGTNAEIVSGLSEGDTVYYEKTDSTADFMSGTFVGRLTGGNSSEESE